MENINAELIEDDNNTENTSTRWQLIHTDPKTRLKTYFRFSNK